MANLAELTDPAAVRWAVEEFRRLGRVEFLALHRFEKSRDYFIRIDGELVDSKPIVGVAYGVQHPDRGPLAAADFSGGTKAAVRALERLEFEVVTRAQIRPPILGESFDSRSALYEAYGGDKVAGIIRLPGEEIVNVFSDADGPYADDPPTLTEPFGYRGEGLNGPHRVHVGGNALLEQARLNGEAVRFWYRPANEAFTFLTWAVVVGRAWVIGVGQDGQPRQELEWAIEAVPGALPANWSTTVRATVSEARAATDDGPSVPEAAESPTYRELVDRVNRRGQPRRPTGVLRVDYARSAAARRAVLVRCAGLCESPSCTGMPAECNRRGEPILDVDHITDLAKGGEDHPRNMAALCPNCHASKTRGRDPRRWRQRLLLVVAAADAEALR
jgi:5-methylcytosine-specific restriction protein A